MADVGVFDSIARNLGGRGMLGGSFQLRLIIQPLLALLLGLRFGIRDAKMGKRPYFHSMVTQKGDRAAMFKRSLRDAIVPLCIALIVDSILQQMINHRIRPLVAVIDGALLVYLPFMIGRGLGNRIWTHGRRGSGPGGQVPQAP